MSTSDNRMTITESEYERIVDRAVQNRLQHSGRYRNAANAEEQSAAEEAITLEVERDHAGRYKIAGQVADDPPVMQEPPLCRCVQDHHTCGQPHQAIAEATP